MLTIGSGRRLPGVNRTGLGPGLAVPMNVMPGAGLQALPLPAGSFSGGGIASLATLATLGGRHNGNMFGSGNVSGARIGDMPGIPPLGPLNSLGPVSTLRPYGGVLPMGGLNTLGPLNSFPALTTTYRPLPLAMGGTFNGQASPALPPLSALNSNISSLTPQQLIALQALTVNGLVGLPQLLSLLKNDNENPPSDGQPRRVLDFKHKDITVRGVAYAVRTSYLNESSKFENELCKYMDKKKEEDVPDKIVGMLISYINWEEYDKATVLDEVMLNILASNVGAKSAIEHTLKQLSQREGDISDYSELVQIIFTILMSGRVDAGLTNWLTGLMKKDGYELLVELVTRSEEYYLLVMQRPEIHNYLLRMVEVKPQPDDAKYHTM